MKTYTIQIQSEVPVGVLSRDAARSTVEVDAVSAPSALRRAIAQGKDRYGARLTGARILSYVNHYSNGDVLVSYVPVRVT